MSINQKGFHHLPLILAVVVIGTIGLVGWWVTQKSNSDNNQSSSKVASQGKKSAKPALTIDKTGAFKLEPATPGSCTALLPSGWSTPSVNDASTSFDAFNQDKSMYAGYAHPTVNTNLAGYASLYDPPLDDPDLYSNDPADVALAYSRIVISSMGGDSSASYSTETDDQVGDYYLRSVVSSTHKGVVFFHAEGFPGDGMSYTYSVPIYFGLAKADIWKSNGLSLAKVSASINCTAQLVARSSGPDIDSSSGEEAKKDNNGDESGYNPQLGTEYVHDPNTKENYLVDPSRDWSSSGPDGAGYYKQNGNDYTQLQPGRAD